MGDDDDEVSEEDIQFYAENEGARMFLRNLDTVGITRCVYHLVQGISH